MFVRYWETAAAQNQKFFMYCHFIWVKLAIYNAHNMNIQTSFEDTEFFSLRTIKRFLAIVIG